MDCKTAHSLLQFTRPQGYDLDATDRTALDDHLAVCPECDSAARAERQFDDHLGRAIRDVPVPNGLKDRLERKLRQQRDDWWKQVTGRGMRYAAAAAAVLIVVFVGFSVYRSQKPVLDPDQVIDQIGAVSYAPLDREAAESFFASQGHRVSGPGDFNYNYLRSCNLAELKTTSQKRVLVPQLLFVRPGGQVAEVFILSEDTWNLKEFSGEVNSSSGDTIKVKIRPPSGLRASAYAIRYSGDLSLFLGATDRQSE
jgi:hypothetical protein